LQTIQLKEEIMQTTPDNTGFGSASTSAVSNDVRADVEHVGKSAANRIHSELDNRKGATAQQVKSLSSALGQAADGLDEGSPQWLKSAFQQGAQQVQRFADSLEQKDSRQILNEVTTMARSNPGMFLAACAGLGFAAARIFKAGPSDSFQGQSQLGQFQQGQSQQGNVPPTQGEEPKYRPAADLIQTETSTGEYA
jgi:hypothetical protein